MLLNDMGSYPLSRIINLCNITTVVHQSKYGGLRVSIVDSGLHGFDEHGQDASPFVSLAFFFAFFLVLVNVLI